MTSREEERGTKNHQTLSAEVRDPPVLRCAELRRSTCNCLPPTVIPSVLVGVKGVELPPAASLSHACPLTYLFATSSVTRSVLCTHVCLRHRRFVFVRWWRWRLSGLKKMIAFRAEGQCQRGRDTATGASFSPSPRRTRELCYAYWERVCVFTHTRFPAADVCVRACVFAGG